MADGPSRLPESGREARRGSAGQRCAGGIGGLRRVRPIRAGPGGTAAPDRSWETGP
ncbi:hypothetical protein GCM10009834_44800 [Streptomonospora arabica]